MALLPNFLVKEVPFEKEGGGRGSNDNTEGIPWSQGCGLGRAQLKKTIENEQC